MPDENDRDYFTGTCPMCGQKYHGRKAQVAGAMYDALAELLARVNERCGGNIEGNSALAISADAARAALKLADEGPKP